MAMHWREIYFGIGNFVYKTNVNSQYGWESDHKGIIWICHALVGNKFQDQKNRNFFYQTWNGYWNSNSGKFQFDTHLDGFLCKVEGNLVMDLQSHEPISLCIVLQYWKSYWKEKWRKKAIVFLFEQYSPRTKRVPDQMMNFQILRSI